MIRSLAAGLVLGLVLTAGAAQLRADEPAVNLRAMKTALTNASLVMEDKNATREARAAALKSVGAFDHPTAAGFLLSRLGRIANGVAFNDLVTDRNQTEVIVELPVIEAQLARLASPGAAELMVKGRSRMRNSAGLTLLQGLKSVPGTAVDALFAELLEGSRTDPRERIIAIEAAGLREMRSAVPFLIRTAADTANPFGVRCTAMRALARMPDAAAVAPLIECTAQGGRIACEAHNALWSITGERYSLKGQWLTWWNANEAGFVPEAVPVLHDNHEIRGDIDWQRFYGIPVAAARVLFVLDRSGSMQHNGKMEGVKQELRRIARAFSGQKSYNILFFNTSIKLWQEARPWLVPADDRSRERLDVFLKSMHPGGGTATEEAMYEAVCRQVPSADIETIIMLSDGLPNSDPHFVQQAVIQMNRYARVRIHTICIAEPGMENVAADKDSSYSHTGGLTAAAFMQGIAEASDGLFRSISVEEAAAGGQ